MDPVYRPSRKGHQDYSQNILNNIITRFGILFLAFIASILTARALGPEQKGVLAYAWIFFALLATYGHLGINNVVIYFHRRLHISYARLISTNGTFLLILSLTYGSVFFFLRGTGIFFTGYTPGFLSWGVVYIFANYILLLLKGYYIAYENLIPMNRYALLAESAAILVLAGFYLLGTLTPLACIAISAFSAVIQIILLGKGEQKLLSHLTLRIEKSLLKQEVSYSFHAFLYGLFLFLIYRTDQLLIHFYLGDESLGIYSVSVGIAGCFLFVPESIKTALTGKLYSFAGDSSEKYRYFNKTMRFCVLICTIMAMTGMIMSPLIFRLYGTEFINGIRTLQILLAGMVFLSFSQLGGIYFFTAGEVKKCTIISASSFCINIIMNVLLIPAYGIEGAAVASLISYMALAGMTTRYLLANNDIRLKHLLIPQKEDILTLKRIVMLLK